MTRADEREFEVWRKINRQMLNGTFSGKLSQTPKKEVEQYFKALVQIWKQQSPERQLYAHSTVVNAIANYFDVLAWNYNFEVPLADLDFSHRFDLMARRGAKVVIVEVKPEISTRDLGQVLGYVFAVKRHFQRGRVFLGTDIRNLNVVLGGGEITDILVDNARSHGLGVILADKEQAWLIPAEFMLA